jgi:ketosteroid isomerase-like protein
MSTPDLAVVRRYVDSIGRGDLKTIMTCLHPDFVLNEPATLPYGGDHVGHAGFAGLAYQVASHYLTELLDSRVHDAGEFAVVRMRFRFTSKRTGRSLELPLLELYWFSDGLMVRGEVFYKDTKAVLALLDDESAAVSSPAVSPT